MIVIVCVDNNNGMMFNKRRQSQDRLLRERIISQSGGKLWLNGYSSRQFEKVDNLRVDENFLDNAAAGETCFVENIDVTPYLAKIEKIILYKWNRRYPSDFRFNANILNSFSRVSVEDFYGYSHETLTEEVYQR